MHPSHPERTMCFSGKAFGNVVPLDIRHLFHLWAKRLCNQDKYQFLWVLSFKVGLKQKRPVFLVECTLKIVLAFRKVNRSVQTEFSPSRGVSDFIFYIPYISCARSRFMRNLIIQILTIPRSLGMTSVFGTVSFRTGWAEQESEKQREREGNNRTGW